MKYQKGIWIPKKDTWKVWSKNYEIKAYNKLQLKGDLCLDIGSHVGIWSKRLSKDFNKVICFEPLQKHIDCHMKNCENLNNIQLFKYALSDEEIQTEMITMDFNSGMSSFVEKKFKEPISKVIVNTKTLDSFNLPKVDFMKIDVEGYEKNVIIGGEKTIKKYHPKIYMEVWDKNLKSITKIMNSMGYSVNKFVTNNYLCEWVGM